MAALYARGAGASGEIGIVPLVVGDVEIEISLVGYLRACDRLVVLQNDRKTVAAKAGAPQVVLGSDPIIQSFHSTIPFEALDRRVDLAVDRYRITTMDGNTEISLRQGKNLMVSPTRRFLAVEVDERIEIVDVVDGATVGSLPDGALRWMMEDNFVSTDSAPWGLVSVASTFSPAVAIDRTVTAPSCCMAGEDTHFSINLENNSIAILGTSGFHFAALQNSDFSVYSEMGGGSFGSVSGIGNRALYRSVIESIGPVAPIGIPDAPNFVGGSSLYVALDETSTGPVTASVETQRDFLSSHGVPVQAIEVPDTAQLQVADASIPLVRSTANATDVDDSLVNQFSRLNIAIRESPTPTIHAIGDGQSWVEQVYAAEGIGDLAAARAQFDKERLKAGYDFAWLDPAEDPIDMDRLYCEHIGTETPDGRQYVPTEFDELMRVEQPGGNIWILRVACVGGPTMGTQLGNSMLLVFDLSKPYSGEAGDSVVATNSWFAGTLTTTFYEYNFSAALFDRKLVFFAPLQGKIQVLDLDTREFEMNTDNLPNGDLLSAFYALEGLTHYVATGTDGSLSIIDADGGEVVLVGRIVDDEIVVWNDAFQFDSTAEGASFVDVRFPGMAGQYSFELFASALRVENLGARVLAGETIAPPQAVGIPPSLTGNIAAVGDEIDVSISPSNDDVAKLLVYRDGALAEERDVSGANAEMSFRLPRAPGQRWASVVAVDKEGLLSLPLSADLGADTTIGPAAVLAIGVDYYEDARIGSLNFAKSDVGKFVEALASLPGAPAVEPAILTDRRATPDAILAAVAAFADGLAPWEHGVLFLAGHGLRGDDGTFYFGTSGANLDDLEGTTVRWDALAAALADTRGRITVFIDACHSGATSSNAFASNDEAVDGLVALGDARITIFAASKGRELSGETAASSGGVFTEALAEVMTSSRDLFDTNGNGALEAEELYRGVKALVVAWRDGKQTPWFSGNSVAGNYAIF